MVIRCRGIILYIVWVKQRYTRNEMYKNGPTSLELSVSDHEVYDVGSLIHSRRIRCRGIPLVISNQVKSGNLMLHITLRERGFAYHKVHIVCIHLGLIIYIHNLKHVGRLASQSTKQTP